MKHDCAICGKDLIPLDPQICPVTLEGKTFYFCHADNMFGCRDYAGPYEPYPTAEHDEMNCTRCLLEKSKR